MNCTECISWIPGENVCGRGINVTVPAKTVCRKWLKHSVVPPLKKDGVERHYLMNAAGKMFDITDQIIGKAKKKEEDDKPANG